MIGQGATQSDLIIIDFKKVKKPHMLVATSILQNFININHYCAIITSDRIYRITFHIGEIPYIYASYVQSNFSMRSIHALLAAL